MPEIEGDVSTSESPADNPVNPENDSAVVQTPDEPQVPETAVTENTDSSDVEVPETPTVDDAIALLTGEKKNKAAKSGDKKPDDKPETSPDKKTQEKKVDDPKVEDDLYGKDISAEERKRLGRKADQRIRELHRKYKETEEKLTAVTSNPKVEQGETFAKFLDDFKLRDELDDLGDDADEAVAGAISFHSALNRVVSNKARGTDRQVIEDVFGSLDKIRSRLGMSPQVPTVDLAPLERAFAKARETFDLTDLAQVIATMKATKPQAPQPVVQRQPAPQPEVRQPQAQAPQPQIHPDMYAYSDMLADELATSNIPADKQLDYFKNKLYPKIINKIAEKHPNDNAATLYSKLSPRAQYDWCIKAHQELQKQLQAIVPQKKPSVAPSTPRPISGSGTQRLGGTEMPTTSSKAAIQFLTGS